MTRTTSAPRHVPAHCLGLRLGIGLGVVLGLGLLALPLAADTGFRGCLAQRGQQVLATENADRLFVPASVQKLLVAAAALHHLGPDYRIETTVGAANGPVGGVLDGDLIVVASGDPTWNSRFDGTAPTAGVPKTARVPSTTVQRWAAALKQAGVRHIRGSLRVDTHRFPGRPFPPSRAIADIAFGFAAPSSAMAIEENIATISVRPGARVGDAAQMEVLSKFPDGSPMLRLVNHTTTAPRHLHGHGTVDFQPVWHSEQLVLSGEYPISEPSYRIDIGLPNGALYAARYLTLGLRQAGIRIDGEPSIQNQRQHQQLQDPAVTLFTLRSPPLTEILKPILTDSHNWYAEMLNRVLAAQVRGEGRSRLGLEVLAEFLVEQVGVPTEAFALDDASGISPHNLLSPRTVLALLNFIDAQPWRSEFQRALARPGAGTLRGWPALPTGTVAKTGTLRNTLALAGWAGGKDSEFRFVCFTNHRVEDRTTLRRELTAQVRAWHRQ